MKLINGEFTVWTDNGSVKQNTSLTRWLENIESLPIGEVYLNSVDRDGTGHGYQTELIKKIPDLFSTPIILAGGAGKYSHFSEVLQYERVDAVATANLFNFIGDGLEKNRKKLLDENFNLATWDINLATDLKNCL